MKYCDHIHDDVESLASQKAFGDLTPEERDTVLHVLGSADAYSSLRSMVLKVRTELAVDAPFLEPRASSRESLCRMVETSARQRRRIPFTERCKAAVSRRIPVSYSAAAVIAAIAVTMLLTRQNEQPALVEKIVYIERPVAVSQSGVHHAEAQEHNSRLAVDSAVRKAVSRKPHSAEVRSIGTVLRDTAREAVAAVVQSVSTTLPGSVRNEFVGLGNLRYLQGQFKGRTLAEDSSRPRFVRPFSKDTL